LAIFKRSVRNRDEKDKNEIDEHFLDSTPTRNKANRVVQQPKTRTVQLKNILFKYPKRNFSINNNNNNNNNNNSTSAIKDRMKQPIVADKTRCAVLISANGKTIKQSSFFE